MASIQPSGSREERLQRVVARGQRLRLLGRLRWAAVATATLAITGAVVGVTVVDGGNNAEMGGPLATAQADALTTRPIDPDGGMEAVAEGILPLAKADGWRESLLQNDDDAYGIFEIAYDREAAERAWSGNVPTNLPPADGMPEEPGVYGELSDVDYESHAVVVWTFGESGSCPSWLADVNTIEGRISFERRYAAPGRGDHNAPVRVDEVIVCTSDYNPYRMVLAVPRDRLPDRGDLPIKAPTSARFIRVTEYPEPSPAPTGGKRVMAEGMVPLAKADGWRDDLRPRSSGFASRPSGSFLEIAYDREAAERAWRENVPGGLPPREGMPEDPGLYGELSDVDFERQAVVVWSSGESGTCPGWLADVNTRGGRVEVEERIAQEVTWVGDYGCTDDRRTYRMVLAVPRDKLPSRGDLPIEQPSGLMVFHITEYPATESS